MIKVKLKGNLVDSLNLQLASKKKEKIQTILNDLKDATPVDTGFARESWKFENDAIVNDAEYIDRLNEGSSTQAPEYFVEKTLLSHKGVYPSGTIVRSK